MKHSGGFKTKVASAVKFFFVGDEEPLRETPALAKELSLAELDLVNGGRADSEAYLRELCRKYGVKNRYDALALATDEELVHHIELSYN